MLLTWACQSPLRAAPREVVLARRGVAAATVVLADGATSAEKTAAAELATYLGKVTGGTFPVVPESTPSLKGPCVYVGPTRFAQARGLEATRLGPEEWVQQTSGPHLILIGGRPRGTLYSVYRFLEDVVGVHWWNAYEESVPRRPSLALRALNRRGQPVFRYRDIYMLYANDGGRFAARNRLNREGDARITGRYGGCMDYGPPYHVHTFYLYFPPDRYLAQHPDWFSLIDGKRVGEQAQLCLTNEEMRRAFLEKLRAYIAESRAVAARRGEPAPQVFSVSQNDWGGHCQCDRCQAIARAEGSESGPLLDFVNFLADAIREEYPDVYLDTLAYQHTQQAPRRMRARDNVIIRLCDTGSNFTRPITDPENRAFREHLLSWARIARNLRVWDYAVTYGPHYGLPLPTVHTYPVDYRFYAEHHVEGVFTEHEYPILADLRDLKIWMMMKLLEDPYRDYDALLRQFTDGFYGPAGSLVREYLRRLEAASAAHPSYLSMGASPSGYRYLNLAFVRTAHALFDRAERAVQGNPVLTRRVRHARLPLDRATLVLHRNLVHEWVMAGNPPERFPLDRDAIARRCRATWCAEADLRLPEAARANERAAADREIGPLIARKAFVPLPRQFRHLQPGTVIDYLADAARNWNDIAKVVPDPEAESGITNRLELSDADMTRYALPMPWGLYDPLGKKTKGRGAIRPEDVPGPGYHWYRLGAFPIGPSDFVYFFWSWIIQVDVGNVCDPKRPSQPWEVWACVKFEGPGFPHGTPAQKNAICVERVVLRRAGSPDAPEGRR